eukprot:2309012-Prorocentrum_lima.AAC.1
MEWVGHLMSGAHSKMEQPSKPRQLATLTSNCRTQYPENCKMPNGMSAQQVDRQGAILLRQ